MPIKAKSKKLGFYLQIANSGQVFLTRNRNQRVVAANAFDSLV
jgi:hypothetical protein